MREEAFSCKDKRDTLNEAVQALKAKREDAKQELAAKREAVSSIHERIRELEPKLTLKEGVARKRLRELDWRIQTTTLSLAEEKRSLAEVKSLELELAVHEEIRKEKNEASRLFSEMDKLRSTIEKYHNELSKSAKISQECHEQMMSSLKEADQLAKEAETTHQAFVEVKRKADDLHKNYTMLISRIREIERHIREIDENVHREQIRKALESREKVSKVAQEKLQTGEKLTFEEFKILIERGEV